MEEAKRKPGRPQKQEQEVFDGFIPEIHDTYFRMPAIWIDVCAHIDNLAELKVTQYVLRHSWGHRDFDTMKHITVDEFVNGRLYKQGEYKGERMDSGTGLSESAVKDGLKRAIQHGWLVCSVDDHDKARIKKYYALKMREESIEENEEVDNSGEGVVYSPDRVNNSPDESCLPPRTEERTREQTSKNKDRIRTVHPSQNTLKGTDAKTPLFIRNMIEDFSRELGDEEHIASNIGQAHRLYHQSGMGEEDFIKAIYAARESAKRASVKKVNTKGWPNRMPYFFTCLRKLSNSVENQQAAERE